MAAAGPVDAILSGYRNNCAFHSVIHQLFNADQDVQTSLFIEHPVYKHILENFYNRFPMPNTNPNDLNTFFEINRVFTHPTDREMIWGPVLRMTLRDILQAKNRQADVDSILDGKFVYDNLLAELTNEMGIGLRVRNVNDPLAPAVQAFGNPNAALKADLVYTGGHYNFSYSNQGKNQAHNLIRNNGQSLLLPAQAVVGVVEQEQAIADIVSQKLNKNAPKGQQEEKAGPAAPAKPQQVVKPNLVTPAKPQPVVQPPPVPAVKPQPVVQPHPVPAVRPQLILNAKNNHQVGYAAALAAQANAAKLVAIKAAAAKRKHKKKK